MEPEQSSAVSHEANAAEPPPAPDSWTACGVSPPRRSPVLVTCAILVIGGCILAVSYILAAIKSGDHSLALGAVCLLPFLLVLGLAQYCAVFRSAPRAALVVVVMLLLVGIPLLTFLVGALFVVAATMNLRWWWLNHQCSQQVDEATWENPKAAAVPDWFPRYSLRELLGAVTVAAVICGLAAWIARSMEPEYAEDIARDQAPLNLPAGATDISYCRLYNGTLAYEFTTDADGFCKWVESGMGPPAVYYANTVIQPISSPILVYRYCNLSPKLSGRSFVTVSAGLHYSPYARMVAVFDSTTNRAYYYHRLR